MIDTIAADAVVPAANTSVDAYRELEAGVHAALETYSNVHRGSGHNSLVSTRLFEQARDIVLEHLGLEPRTYVVVFCTPRRARCWKRPLPAGSFQVVSSEEIGLPLGVRALAIERRHSREAGAARDRRRDGEAGRPGLGDLGRALRTGSRPGRPRSST